MYHEDTYGQHTGGGGFMMGLMCGTALGVAAALMFAPFAGSEARERLAGQAQRFREKATETYDRVSKKVDETVRRAGEAYTDATESMNRSEPLHSDYRT